MVHATATLVPIVLLAAQAAAHGVVEWFVANGQNYTGDDVFDPKGSAYKSHVCTCRRIDCHPSRP